MRGVESRRVFAAAGVLLAAGLCLAGCQPADPQDRIEAQRRLYSASLEGFQVVASSPATPKTAATPTATPVKRKPKGAAPSATPSPSPEDGVGLLAPPVATSDVELSLVLHNGSTGSLPGLTLEVALLAGDEEEQHYRIWVDTAQLAPGATGESRSVLREVPYVTGQRFVVSVRDEVPPPERALYREFPRS